MCLVLAGCVSPPPGVVKVDHNEFVWGGGDMLGFPEVGVDSAVCFVYGDDELLDSDDERSIFGGSG